MWATQSKISHLIRGRDHNQASHTFIVVSRSVSNHLNTMIVLIKSKTRLGVAPKNEKFNHPIRIRSWWTTARPSMVRNRRKILRDHLSAHHKYPKWEVVIMFSRVSPNYRVNSISQRIQTANPLRVGTRIKDWTILGLVGEKLRARIQGTEVVWCHRAILCKIAK